MRFILATALLIGTVQAAERTPNFVAASPNVSRQMLVAAELARVRSAKYWIGRELPNWSHPCPIQWKETGSSGGGATSFKFYLNGDQPAEVANWNMHVEGRRDKVIADVIPHEVDHAVRASIIRKRIVRVLDEGSATLMESPSTSVAIGFLQQRLNRGESLRGCWDWVEATKYPSESHRLGEMYEFSISLVRYLVAHHGKSAVLELSKHYPRVLPHWDRVIGESPEATREKWLAWHLGKSQKRIVYVGTAPGCGQCVQFKSDYKNGRLPTDVEYRFVEKDSAIHHQVARQLADEGYAVPRLYPWFWVPRCRCQPRSGYDGIPWFLSWLPRFPNHRERYRRVPAYPQTQPERTSPNVTFQPPPEDPGTTTTENSGPSIPAETTSSAEPVDTVPAEPEPEPEEDTIVERAKNRVKQKAPGFFEDVVRAALGAAPTGPLSAMQTAVLGGTTGGTGIAVVMGAKFAYGLWRRRRERLAKQKPTPNQNVPVAQPVAVQPTQPVADVRVDAIIDLLKNRGSEALDGAIVKPEVGADGSTVENLWKDGVRMAAAGHPEIGALGGRFVGEAIERYVAKRYAENARDTLRTK